MEITLLLKKKIKILLNKHVSGNICIFWGRALLQCRITVIDVGKYYMPDIDVNKCKGQVDTALRRLKRLCDKLGVARRWREIEHHEKKTAKRRRQIAAAKKREQKRTAMERVVRRTKRR